MVQTIDMPAPSSLANGDMTSPDAPVKSYTSGGSRRSVEQQTPGRRSGELPTPAVDALPGAWPATPGLNRAGSKEGSLYGAPNGSVSSERTPNSKRLSVRRSGSNLTGEGEKRSGEIVKEERPRPGVAEEGYFSAPAMPNGKPVGGSKSSPGKARDLALDGASASTARSTALGATPMTPISALPPVEESSPAKNAQIVDGLLKPPIASGNAHRASSPPAFNRDAIPSMAASQTPLRPDRLGHRHTLEVPKLAAIRTSRDGGDPTSMARESVTSVTSRFAPNTPTKRRGSLQLGRRATRSLNSDMHLDEVPPDEDAARWAELYKAKRASRRQRADTDDERVVVGTKVDQHHANYETAYNMLTGIRFAVSRTNAKLDHELTDADFKVRHKFTFDITGNELTPGTKFDFKFKDYAPFVFRHLRATFKLDPAEYLMSLTAKYILSELGSPGKSGSFFYFSRDYKYIIKTIHHAEHKFLRKILKEYYNHVVDNPNTLLSQFYGLHRVKTGYGRKIHFVVMNNLFPPHRDIHRTFDLKGSTIGRDFKEEDLERNPRATLKDLNWLRRGLHLEFGPTKKDVFVAQMQKDVALLQRLKIMDYSLLVGIHDLERGNEENLRDKTLQVFQPGGDQKDEPRPHHLARTPSKMENEKRAKELRSLVKRERPVPMDQTLDKMPDEVQKRETYFYADDGGFQATHEDDSPGEVVYYLGIIDCLTRYNYIKKAEHFWKGMGSNEPQISAIPPDRYGDRFVKFISGVTSSRERAEKERLSSTLEASAGVIVPEGIEGSVYDPNLGGLNKNRNPTGTADVMEKANHVAEKSMKHGAREEEVPDRTVSTVRSPGDTNHEAATLPVIGEAAESASNVSHASRTPSKASRKPSREEFATPQPKRVLGDANMPSASLGEVPPPTPPKVDGTAEKEQQHRRFWGGKAPPTPPKDERKSSRTLDKQLPVLPPIQASTRFSMSPARIGEEERELGFGGSRPAAVN